MNLAQRRLIMNAFILAQFGYCPLVWMFYSRKLNKLNIVFRDYESTFQQLLKHNESVSVHQKNLQILATEIFKTKNSLNPLIRLFASKTAINKILKIHYRTLQVVYSEYHKSCEEHLQINKDISIHQKHLRILALEVYKRIMHFNPEFVWDCFNTNPIPYNLRKGSRFLIPPAKSVNFGINSITFKGSLLWNNLPLRCRNSQAIDDFKFELKNLREIHCTCTVCR